MQVPVLTFDAAHAWSVGQEVTVSTTDDAVFTAKDSASYACGLSHTVSSEDPLYAAVALTLSTAPVVRTLSSVM